MKGIEPLRGAQGKFKGPGKILTAEEIQAEVAKAIAFELNGLRLGKYYILSTSENDTEAQAAVITLNIEHRKGGRFEIELLTWPVIEEFLRANPSLWDEIFGRSLKSLIQPIHADVAMLVKNTAEVSLQIADSQSRSGYDQRLEAAKSFLDMHDRQAAALLLQTLRNNNWHDLSEHQRFLTLTYLGRVAYGDGKWTEAGQLYVQAEQHEPGEERARTNRALGLELLRESDQAHAAARAIVNDFPAAIRPWAIICRTADTKLTSDKLESQLPAVARQDDEVLAALAMRALQHRDWETAERFIRPTVRDDVDWAAPWLILGDLKLHRAAAAAYRPVDGPAVFANSDDIESAQKLLDTAVAVATRTHNTFFHARSLMQRGRAKSVVGDEKGAEEDFIAAFHLAPNDVSTVVQYGRHLVCKNQLAAAISLFRTVLSTDGEPDVPLFLASTLQVQNDAATVSERIVLSMRAAEHPNCSDPFVATELALETLIDEQRLEDAAKFLDRLETTVMPKSAIQAGRALILVARGNDDDAKQILAEVVGTLDQELPVECCRFVAEILARIGEHILELPIRERILTLTKDGPDLWKLLSAAHQAERFDVIRRVAKEWRAAGVRDERLIDKELAVLMQFAPLEAVPILDEEILRRPDDRFLVLRKSLLAVHLRRRDLLCHDSTKYPDVTDAGCRNGPLVVHVLAEAGQFVAALQYAYRLLRQYPKEANAHRAFNAIMLHPQLPAELKEQPLVAGLGTAVEYIEKGQLGARTFVIEDATDGVGFDDEIRPDHPLARALIGKHEDDEFLIAGDELDGRTGTIVAISSKYTYRRNESLQNWQIRFADDHSVEMFRVAGPGPDQANKIPDLIPMIRRVHARRQSVDEVFELYRNQPVPIHVLAGMIGKAFIETFDGLARSRDLFVRCCSGDMAEAVAANEGLEKASTCVLDLSAIATLRLLGLVDRLADWPKRPIVSSGTLAELARYASKCGTSHAGSCAVPTTGGVGMRIIETDPNEYHDEQASIDRTIKSLREHAEILDCPAILDLLPEQRMQLVTLLGQHGLESVLLASAAGSVLWTDDVAVAMISHQEFGCPRAWTQIVLAQALRRGVLQLQEFHEASAKLVGFDYRATQFDVAVLLAACRLADWQASHWPLDEALRPFKEIQNAGGKLAVAVQFIREVFEEDLVTTRHSDVLITLFDRIADGEMGLAAVAAIRSNLPSRFGLDVIALRSALALLDQWFRVRGAAR